MEKETISELKKAGQIAKQVREYASTIVKPNTPLLEIAEKIEAKILELGAKPAFPVNLSINEIAAHSTPSYNDEAKAHGLLKVDIGCHLNGLIADTAITIDLESSEENQNLINAAQKALEKAITEVKINSTLSQIGETIEKEIKAHDCQQITNLSGHSIDEYNLHSGLTIPNYNNSSQTKIEEGLYAIEPFTTLSTKAGMVKDGKPSSIFRLDNESSPVRDPTAREILKFIKEEYSTLPFCSRWLVKKFGTRALIALKRLEDAKILHQYSQLVESSKGKVAQAEHTVLLTKDEKIITTL